MTQDKDNQNQGGKQAGTVDQTDQAKDTLFTQEEVDEKISKVQSTFEKKWRQSDAEAKTAKEALAEREVRLVAQEQRLAAIEAESERQQMQVLDGHPEGDQIKELYRQNKADRVEIARQKKELEAIEKDAYEGLKFKDATKLSKEFDIDAEELMECNTKAEMEIKARDLMIARIRTGGRKGDNLDGDGESKKKENPLPKKIDEAKSNVTSPKGRVFTVSEINDMTPDQRFALKGEFKIAQQEGRILNK